MSTHAVPNVVVATVDGLHSMGDQPRVDLQGRDVTHVVRNGATLWALVNGDSVWYCDSTDTWQQVATLDRWQGTALLPAWGSIFIATAEAHLLRLSGSRVEPVRGFERTHGRDTWFTPWGGPPDTRSLALGINSALYANVHVGGIVRSTDMGQTWQPTLDIHADVHQVAAHPADPNIALCAAARGLGVSRDGGLTWQFQTAGLHGSYSRAVTVGGDTVFVTASTGPFAQRAAVYRKLLNSKGAFERCEAGLPAWFPTNIDSMCLAARADTVAFATAEGQVFASTDTGVHWQQMAEGLSVVRCVLLP